MYQLHRPDDTTPIEETLGVLDELVREGKVRWIGSSNFSAEQIDAAETVARDKGLNRFVSLQNEYSLFHRETEEDVLPACERLGIGVLPYFPLASGLLTGKYRLTEKPAEGRLADREIAQDALETVEALIAYGEARGISILDIAIGGCSPSRRSRRSSPARRSPSRCTRTSRPPRGSRPPADLEELRALL